MPTVAAAMQPGALVEYGRDGDSYEAPYGDGEPTQRTGSGQPTRPRWETYGSYDAGNWHDSPQERTDWGDDWYSESAQGNAWHANGSQEDSSAWQDGSDWHESNSWAWYRRCEPESGGRRDERPDCGITWCGSVLGESKQRVAHKIRVSPERRRQGPALGEESERSRRRPALAVEPECIRQGPTLSREQGPAAWQRATGRAERAVRAEAIARAA